MEAVTTRQVYVEQLRRWLPGAYERYDEQTRQWLAGLSAPNPFGDDVNTPDHPVTLSLVEAFLAVEDRDDRLAAVAGQRLATLRQFADRVPAAIVPDRADYRHGVPPHANYFTLPHYCEAYQLLRDHPALSRADHAAIQANIADSLPPLFSYAEWGSHNRTMLRAWTLAAAAAACPDCPERARWLQLARQLAADNLRGWTVEDASLYHAIWSRAVIAYADQAHRSEELYRQPTTRFYFEYYLNLLCPIGGIADFGDSDWAPNSQLYVAIFERAAREYGDGCFRWAACELYRRLAGEAGSQAFGDPTVWVHCARWVDEGVEASRPTWGSGEVLEELATKKVVFRSGWAPRSTFLLLNYKPETDYGRTIREYMKSTISAEAEKTHHGHSDENSISTLVSQGALLLHDGGYRESFPNGRYRADYYHARPVVRRGLLREGGSVYDFLHDDGHHRPMETERIDLRTFDEVEFSRTRATDRQVGYEHDRVVAYLKRAGMFIVVDSVAFLQEGPYTICNLLYTHEILASGRGWFDTRLGAMRNYTPAPEAGDQRLLVVQLLAPYCWSGSEGVRRYFRDEILLHQSTSGRGAPRQRRVFYTALVPHDGSADPAALAARVAVATCSRFPAAAAVQLRRGAELTTVGVKLDLEDEILFQDVRPRYDWDSGRTRYGDDYETDARFFYARREGDIVSWAWTEATRLDCGGRSLFRAPERTYALQYAGEAVRTAVSKWRAWEEVSRLT